jgi:transcriptional/translational regulatory protein YebC/TACO1
MGDIKHKKGAADAKRGQMFTKLIKEISIAARMGGGDPTPTPASALQSSKPAAQHAQGQRERAIKMGTGELDGVSYEELIYEATPRRRAL